VTMFLKHNVETNQVSDVVLLDFWTVFTIRISLKGPVRKG